MERPKLASLRALAWVIALAILGVGLPVAWRFSVARWLQFGHAARPIWPAITLAQLAAISLMAWRLGPIDVRFRRWSLVAGAVAWCAGNAVWWQATASSLVSSFTVTLLYVATTWWLAWWGLMFLSPRSWPIRLGTLVALWLPVGLWFACVRSDGVDGGGRPMATWSLLTQAQGATVSAAPRHDGRLSIPSIGEAASYPAFRGRNGLGIVDDVGLSGDWSAKPPHKRWRRPVGAGWGGLVVERGLVFSQEQMGDDEAVACYDLATGQERWRHLDRACFVGATTGDGPRATPNCAGDRVYALGATGILNCLDLQAGSKLWSRDVLADAGAGNLYHGMSGSPIVVGDLLIVSVGGRAEKSLLAYDRFTGRRAWSGGSQPAGYGSPLVCTLDGTPQVLVLNRPGLAAHDPQTGRLLWTFAWTNAQETNCSQPAPVGPGKVLVSTGYGKGSVLLNVRRDGDGRWRVEPAWTSRALKTKFSSAVVRGDFAYGLDDGILCCIQLSDGARRWKAGRYGHGQVLLVGDRLLVQAESGEIVLVAAEPLGHREFARFAPLSSKTWNYPALDGRLLLVRNDREAACYELPLSH